MKKHSDDEIKKIIELFDSYVDYLINNSDMVTALESVEQYEELKAKLTDIFVKYKKLS